VRCERIFKNSAEMFPLYFHSLGSHAWLGMFRQQSQSAGAFAWAGSIFSHPRHHDLLSLSTISLRMFMHQTSS
jgi:hypothetical protein